MKTIFKSAFLAAALFGLASISPAAPNIAFPKGEHVIKSKAEADKLPQGSNIALVCPDCKTVVASCCVDDKAKSFHSWFKGEEKHGCSGCKGEITYKPIGKTGGNATHTHVCSKCDKGSPYTCADHAPDAK